MNKPVTIKLHDMSMDEMLKELNVGGEVAVGRVKLRIPKGYKPILHDVRVKGDCVVLYFWNDVQMKAMRVAREMMK